MTQSHQIIPDYVKGIVEAVAIPDIKQGEVHAEMRRGQSFIAAGNGEELIKVVDVIHGKELGSFDLMEDCLPGMERIGKPGPVLGNFLRLHEFEDVVVAVEHKAAHFSECDGSF